MSAIWRARFRAIVNSRWCWAQVPVLRRGSIFASNYGGTRSINVDISGIDFHIVGLYIGER